MSSASVTPQTSAGQTERTDAAGRLRRIAAFGAAGMGLAVAGSLGVGIPCPWRGMTGTLCPLCGGTHLGISLLRGDVPGAFETNPFLFAVLVGVLVVSLASLIELTGGPRWRPPAWLRGDRLWLALGVVALTYAVARNVGLVA